MKPLESRKQLLVAESELNRAQLAQEWGIMAEEARTLAQQARTIGSLATAAASLVGGLITFRRKATAPTAEKIPWWQTLLKSAGLIAALWQTFRPPGGQAPDK